MAKLSAPVFRVRKMSKDDVETVLEIWRENKLFEGTHTLHTFIDLDPDGLYVAEKESDAEILGMCGGVFIHPSVAFIGLYAVRPHYQGMGIGIKIWKNVMEHVNGWNAGLGAVPEQIATYRDKAGFIFEDKRNMVVYAGGPEANYESLTKKQEGVKLVEIDESNVSLVIEYDSQIAGYSREKLLRLSLWEPNTLSMMAIEVETGKVIGYSCFRTNNCGKAMPTPLYSDQDSIAELLISHCIQSFPVARNEGLVLFIIDSNQGALRIAEETIQGLVKHEVVPRLFTKELPKADFDRIYCVLNPDFSPF